MRRCHLGDGKVPRRAKERGATWMRPRPLHQRFKRREGKCSTASGSPGGSEGKAGCGGTPVALMPADGVEDHGKQVSSKYTSDVTTTRRHGTKMLKAPGKCGFRPRFTSSHQARGSMMRVFETAGLGLTARASGPFWSPH
eukprot:359801-Pleurochrysis_carterae.AAC.2